MPGLLDEFDVPASDTARRAEDARYRGAFLAPECSAVRHGRDDGAGRGDDAGPTGRAGSGDRRAAVLEDDGRGTRNDHLPPLAHAEGLLADAHVPLGLDRAGLIGRLLISHFASLSRTRASRRSNRRSRFPTSFPSRISSLSSTSQPRAMSANRNVRRGGPSRPPTIAERAEARHLWSSPYDIGVTRARGLDGAAA